MINIFLEFILNLYQFALDHLYLVFCYIPFILYYVREEIEDWILDVIITKQVNKFIYKEDNKLMIALKKRNNFDKVIK